MSIHEKNILKLSKAIDQLKKDKSKPKPKPKQEKNETIS